MEAMTVQRQNEVNAMGKDEAASVPKRGRPFEKGNGGRKPGSQNRVTQVASALVEGQADKLVQKGVEMALAGDTQMLKFFLDRTLPKEPPIQLELPPLRTASDAVEALALIAQAVAEGRISASQGAAVSSIADRFIRALEVAELSKRITDLEEGLKEDLPV